MTDPSPEGVGVKSAGKPAGSDHPSVLAHGAEGANQPIERRQAFRRTPHYRNEYDCRPPRVPPRNSRCTRRQESHSRQPHSVRSPPLAAVPSTFISEDQTSISDRYGSEFASVAVSGCRQPHSSSNSVGVANDTTLPNDRAQTLCDKPAELLDS